MRLRDSELSKGCGQIVPTLRIETKGGIQRLNCANTEGLFRIIQSTPSPKAEPFKRWQQTGKPVISTGNFKQLVGVKAKKLKADKN